MKYTEEEANLHASRHLLFLMGVIVGLLHTLGLTKERLLKEVDDAWEGVSTPPEEARAKLRKALKEI